jgi:mRNA-degrading endonuclease YafQ of YafQ-DinJ toxin-antitoxin module
LREKVRDFLLKVDSATTLQGFGKIHPLTGRKGVWSAEVTGNWRITFRFNSNAFDIDLEDYHKGHYK